MNALGVWEALETDAQPIREILVTDGAPGRAASPFSLHFDSAEVGASQLGAIVENRHIRAALHRPRGGEKNLDFDRAGRRDEAWRWRAAASPPSLANGETVQASLAIAADGRESRLREAHGVRTIGWSYPQIGIVATVNHEKPHNGIAYEHFLPAGPFAILPMTGNRSSLVWTEDKAKAPGLLALDEEGFNA